MWPCPLLRRLIDGTNEREPRWNVTDRSGDGVRFTPGRVLLTRVSFIPDI